MVVGAFPAAKLGALLLKQVSKPISNAIKERAKSHPFFRRYVCMPPAQFYNWCEVKAKMWVLNLGKPESVPSLNETMAIELGANLLGEAIIFVIAAGALLFEYNRQVKKEAIKEQVRLIEMQRLINKIDDLYFTVAAQEVQIKELNRTFLDLESKVVRKPWKSKKDDSDKPVEKEIDEPVPVAPMTLLSNTVTMNLTTQRGLLLHSVESVLDDIFAAKSRISEEDESPLIWRALDYVRYDVYRRN